MKTKMKNIFYVMMLFALIGCSPEDGKDGVDGVQGEQGIAGQDGLDGEDGEDGNANVVYSEWIPTQFSSNSLAQGKTFQLDMPDSHRELLEASANRGQVLVYGRISRTTANNDTEYLINLLPYEPGFNERYTYQVNITDDSDFNSNFILVAGQSLTVNASDFTQVEFYRYVLLPPPTEAGSSRYNQSAIQMVLPEDIDVNNYAQVASYLNIQD